MRAEILMAHKGDSNLRNIRNDLHAAQSIIADLFPLDSERKTALTILSNTIRYADRLAPASWGVRLFPQRLCLNVGRGAVLQFYPSEIILIVTGRLLNALPLKQRSTFRNTREYNFVPDAIEGRLLAKALPTYHFLSSAHIDLVERAALNRKICFWPHSHSPSVVALLKEGGFTVPKPDAAIAPPAVMEDLDEMDHVTLEGRRKLRTHLVIERNSELGRKKKDRVLAATGKLACEVCTFNFEQFYGPIGCAFAEVHHLNPLGTPGTAQHVRLRDLAIVCSNCHRMLHRGSPLLKLSELRDRLQLTRREGDEEHQNIGREFQA